jgi:hypothetical protein
MRSAEERLVAAAIAANWTYWRTVMVSHDAVVKRKVVNFIVCLMMMSFVPRLNPDAELIFVCQN